MLRKMLILAGTLLGLTALVALTPSPGSAAPRGGGFHGGGFRAGGFPGGGFHAGGFHVGGYRGGYYGGYRVHPYYGGYYGGYGYPYYGNSYGGYYPYYDNAYPYFDSDLETVDGSGDTGSSYNQAAPPPINEAVLTGSKQPAPYYTSAHITVSVPAGARIWFDGTAMPAKGVVREFVSPPLSPGSQYGYDIKASWNDNGRVVTQTQHVEVTAGTHRDVRFPTTPRSAS